MFYFSPDNNQIMTVSYTAEGDAFEPGKPVPFADPIQARIVGFDPAPDGKRMAVAVASLQLDPAQRQAVFLVNFFDELRRKAPAKK